MIFPVKNPENKVKVDFSTNFVSKQTALSLYSKEQGGKSGHRRAA